MAPASQRYNAGYGVGCTHEPDDILSPEDQREAIQQAGDTLKERTRRCRNPAAEKF